MTPGDISGDELLQLPRRPHLCEEILGQNRNTSTKITRNEWEELLTVGEPRLIIHEVKHLAE